MFCPKKLKNIALEEPKSEVQVIGERRPSERGTPDLKNSQKSNEKETVNTMNTMNLMKVKTLLCSAARSLILLSSVFLLSEGLLPSIAHARRGFPLFVIISNNPILMGLGAVLFGIWIFSKNR